MARADLAPGSDCFILKNLQCQKTSWGNYDGFNSVCECAFRSSRHWSVCCVCDSAFRVSPRRDFVAHVPDVLLRCNLGLWARFDACVCRLGRGLVPSSSRCDLAELKCTLQRARRSTVPDFLGVGGAVIAGDEFRESVRGDTWVLTRGDTGIALGRGETASSERSTRNSHTESLANWSASAVVSSWSSELASLVPSTWIVLRGECVGFEFA